ncbi:MAG: homocysteine S-methyltransferase family protein [Bacillota bacterium]|nr:homocysteine S-methyltransferase family protein [Bacillota bacterium]
MDLTRLLGEKKFLIFDGAIGTEMAARGGDTGVESNLSNPQTVLAIHRDYVRAGADMLITNTFILNRISMEKRKAAVSVREVNSAAVRLAVEAAGGKKPVFGDLGPTGELLEPYGTFTEDQFYQCYAEQASILTEEGVDGLIIETVSDLREAVCALKACREKSNLPVILSLAYSSTGKGGRTIMGATVEEAAEAAEKYGADAVGANCGDLDPLGMAEIVALYKKSTALPVIVQPNAGKPKLAGGKNVFDMQPDEFAEGLSFCITAGAAIVGGCCGTTPAHIEALRRRIKPTG